MTKKLVSRFSCLLSTALLAAVAGCGSGFVEGWRHEEGLQGTPEERCERRKGHSWIGGACQEDASIALTDVSSSSDCERIESHGWFDRQCLAYDSLSERQCSQIADSGWRWSQGRCAPAAVAACEADGRVFGPGRCVDRPSLRVDGPLTQTVAAGGRMQELTLVRSVGSLVELRHQTCTGFFAINLGKLVAAEAPAIDSGTHQCEVDLVARTAYGESDPVHVVVKLEPGFLTYCLQGTGAGRKVAQTVRELKTAAGAAGADCKAAAAALATKTSLDLSGKSLVDLTALRGLTQLTTLDLSDNLIVDLAPLSSLTKLEALDLTNNKVADASPLAPLTKLVDLSLEGSNPIAQDGARNERNCPTRDGVSAALKAFCAD